MFSSEISTLLTGELVVVGCKTKVKQRKKSKWSLDSANTKHEYSIMRAALVYVRSCAAHARLFCVFILEWNFKLLIKFDTNERERERCAADGGRPQLPIRWMYMSDEWWNDFRLWIERELKLMQCWFERKAAFNWDELIKMPPTDWLPFWLTDVVQFASSGWMDEYYNFHLNWYIAHL